MSESQDNIAQHTLALLRRMDSKMDEVLLRMSVMERRGALKDEEATLDRLSVVELRQRIERIERRLDLAG